MTARMTARTQQGAAALDAVRDTYDAIAPLPVTARWAWLRATATHFPDWRPLVVTVPGDGEQPRAAALLATRRTGPLTVVTLLGQARSDYAALPAADNAAAAALALAVAGAVQRLPKPWRLRFAQLPAGDPVLRDVADLLRHSMITPGDGAPSIRFDGRPNAEAYSSRNLRKQLKKAYNRLSKEGVTPVTDVASTRDAVAAVLPEVARVHVARDREARGASDFDDPRVAAFWRDVLLDHAARGEVEITTSRVGGDLAAYAVCFRDGDAYRFWDARYAPAWHRYGLGRILDHELVDRVIRDGTCREFDWMRGEEPYKLQTATYVAPYEQLDAWSSPAVRSAENVARSARSGLARARAGAGRARAAYQHRTGDA
jgi:CelD/BcsL family acetyltransferase involved in cellulose biosynthesis